VTAVVSINAMNAGTKVPSPHTRKSQHGCQSLSESTGPIESSTRSFSTSPSSRSKDYFASKSLEVALAAYIDIHWKIFQWNLHGLISEIHEVRCRALFESRQRPQPGEINYFPAKRTDDLSDELESIQAKLSSLSGKCFIPNWLVSTDSLYHF
jgi:hypothetical protein